MYKQWLNSIRNIGHDLKTVDLLLSKKNNEEFINNMTIVGDKYDKKYHVSTLIPLGTNSNDDLIVASTNITSKELINYDKYMQKKSKIKYTLFSNKDKIQNSYETLFNVYKTSYEELDNINSNWYLNNDIRDIVNIGCYPFTAIDKLYSYTNNEDMFYTSSFTDKNIFLNKTDASIAKSIMNNEFFKDINYFPQIKYHLDIYDTLNKKYGAEELDLIELISLNENFYQKDIKKALIIDRVNDKKIYKVYDKSYIEKDKNLCLLFEKEINRLTKASSDLLINNF